MPLVIISFSVYLGAERVNGPQFHRWLPDGQSDALSIPTDEEGLSIHVWLERRGFMARGNFIHYDAKRKEVDPAFVAQHGRLEGGSLYGLLRLEDVDGETLDALRQNQIGDARYVTLGRRVVNLIFPPVRRLLDSLRSNFGQYWLPELEPWDSRSESLGAYCRLPFFMKWRASSEDAWSDFTPTESIVTIFAGPREWSVRSSTTRAPQPRRHARCPVH